MTTVQLSIILMCTTTIISRIMFNRKKKIRKRVFEQAENQEYILENYSIKYELSYYWYMVIYALLLVILFLYNVLIQPYIPMFAFVAIALLIAGYLLCIRARKVTVKGEDIIFRNSFGITKRYRFNDITCAVKDTSGSLEVYSGKKILFAFANNIDYFYFDVHLSQKGIPIISRKEFKKMSAE